MMNTNKKTPKLRFKGFSDDWEQCKLGDIATFSKGNGYSKSDLAPSGEPIILYGRLYTNYETTIRNVDTFVELKDKSVISQGGEVIVPASGETAEDISRASVVKNQGIIIGGDLNVIKVNHLLNPTFLALTISNGEQQKELSKRAQGKSVVHLHNSDLQEVNLTFPLLNEQKEISSLFEKMDSVITLHQCKLEKLKLTKKALLQKLFPKNGKRIPEIRFKGFTDAWEQRNLESLFTKYEDKVKTPNSGYWRLGLRSHCKGTFHTYVDAGNELETAEMNRVQSGNFILNITFAWERALAVTNEEDQDKLVSHRFPQFKPNSDLAIDFFKHTLIDKRFKHHLELSSPGGAGRNKVLKIADMLKYELLVPSIKEQNEISSFLNNVDYIITLYQRKLDRLISIKKALLQQLFV